MKHIRKFAPRAAMGLCLSLAACAATPYATPKVPLPAHFAHAVPGDYEQKRSGDWWGAFGDPVLNRLISEVLSSNSDLAAAALRVKRAQGLADLARLDQFPLFSGGVSASTSDHTSFNANLGIAYEADLWGRLAKTTRSAEWETTATEEDRAAARLALVGTACELYWRIAYTHQQIRSAEQDLDYAQKVLDLVKVQHVAGAVSGVEEAEAQQSLEAQKANLTVLNQQLVAYRSSVTVILGGVPFDEAAEPLDLSTQPLPGIRAGLPTELLGRRPDLQAAELRLREALARVDIAKASFYPDLALTATGGATSPELGALFSHPTGSLVAALSLPFLDYGRLKTSVMISQTDYEIAVLGFKTTLLQAMADTDNALSARTQLALQGDAQKASLDAARKAEAFYALRYRTGSVALRVWLDAQQSLRQSQLNYATIRLSQLLNQSQLYQVLGGSD